MTSERREIPELDGLLQRALSDDLPVHVAAGMRARVALVRAEKQGEGAQQAPWAWLFRRSVWAVLSVLILVAGILLQGANASSPLAKRIASLKTTQAAVEPTRR